MQKIKTWLLNAQPPQARFQIKPVHCADMQNAPVTAQIKNVLDGNHGKIYAPRHNNILIGKALHLHAVAQKDYDKKTPEQGIFLLVPYAIRN